MSPAAAFPRNEPPGDYGPHTPARAALARELERQAAAPVEIPALVGGVERRDGPLEPLRIPHDHGRHIGGVRIPDAADVRRAIQAARRVAPIWAAASQEARSAVFERAAALLAGPWRARVVAATMLGQSKTLDQAEADVCELIDFWRFNPAFAARLDDLQPASVQGVSRNRARWRPLEGFVLAVTPFNFTAIGGNLPTAPALLGNVVLWKPARAAALSSWALMELLREAGLPDGVIAFLPGRGEVIGEVALGDPGFAGLHFTGSTETFNALWAGIGAGVGAGRYRSYPRIVGETGGKDFVVAAPDADPAVTVAALFEGAFEYQGQKCSAASRAYLPRSLWPVVRDGLVRRAREARVGDPTREDVFMGALIDAAAFRRVSSYLDLAREAPDAEVVVGGGADGSRGWFVEPTVVRTDAPQHRLMTEEIFGPVLTVHLYEDAALDETLRLVDRTSPYALTGAVLARDRLTIQRMLDALVGAAGNLYVNGKPTGAVVGQQPFGGARASGTNDKAGSLLNLTRWVSMQVVSERHGAARALQ